MSEWITVTNDGVWFLLGLVAVWLLSVASIRIYQWYLFKKYRIARQRYYVAQLKQKELE
jgi:hypothetical protein